MNEQVNNGIIGSRSGPLLSANDLQIPEQVQSGSEQVQFGNGQAQSSRGQPQSRSQQAQSTSAEVAIQLL